MSMKQLKKVKISTKINIFVTAFQSIDTEIITFERIKSKLGGTTALCCLVFE